MRKYSNAAVRKARLLPAFVGLLSFVDIRGRSRCDLNFIKESVCYDSEDPQTKISRLESENVKMREEFNVQRAKMKELFLQKEGT